MPVKNVKRQTNGGFEGVITGLNDKEKEIISESVGNKYITESTDKLILKPVNTNGNDFEVRTKDNDVVVSFTQNAPGNSSSYNLFTAILSTATNEDGELYNIVARFTKDENWDAKLNIFANAGSSGASFDITIPPEANGNIAMASDLEPLKTDIAKAVKTDTDASLKSLTLPSAKDLKTKDGSSFGGLPSRWEATDVTIVNKTEVEGNIAYVGFIDLEGLNIPTYGYDFSSLNMGKAYIIPIGLHRTAYDAAFVLYSNGDIISRIIVDINFLNTSTDINLSDINKKQSTLYRHTITIHEGSTQDGNSICFTAYTASNTAISSIEQLANTDLDCFGVSGTASALTFYNKIHVGTNLATTTLQKATGGSVALSSVYATYTITDEHGPLN